MIISGASEVGALPSQEKAPLNSSSLEYCFCQTVSNDFISISWERVETPLQEGKIQKEGQQSPIIAITDTKVQFKYEAFN